MNSGQFVLFSPNMQPAFITGVDQVCTVVRDFDATITALTEQLGIGPFKCWTLERPALFTGRCLPERPTRIPSGR